MRVMDLKIDDEYVSVAPDETIKNIAQKLLENYCGTAIVLDGDSVLGAITLDIIIREVVINNKDSRVIKCQDVMDKNIIKVTPEMEITELRNQLAKRPDVAAVIVIDENNKIKGYVSPLDLMQT